nr:MAG TPA: hypothetical protein [Caudoviricetes sp.]
MKPLTVLDSDLANRKAPARQLRLWKFWASIAIFGVLHPLQAKCRPFGNNVAGWTLSLRTTDACYHTMSRYESVAHLGLRRSDTLFDVLQHCLAKQTTRHGLIAWMLPAFTAAFFGHRLHASAATHRAMWRQPIQQHLRWQVFKHFAFKRHLQRKVQPSSRQGFQWGQNALSLTLVSGHQPLACCVHAFRGDLADALHLI